MKKVIDVLSIISVISVILMLVLLMLQNFYGRDYKFISDSVNIILTFPVIPLMGKGASLAVRKDYIKSRTWLIIYGIVLLIFLLLLMFSWSWFSKQMRDLPHAFHQEHLSVTGEAEDIHYRFKGSRIIAQYCMVDNVDFELANSDFIHAKEGEIYSVTYLPNSKYVIDIVDENGNSLLKK